NRSECRIGLGRHRGTPRSTWTHPLGSTHLPPLVETSMRGIPFLSAFRVFVKAGAPGRYVTHRPVLSWAQIAWTLPSTPSTARSGGCPSAPYHARKVTPAWTVRSATGRTITL